MAFTKRVTDGTQPMQSVSRMSLFFAEVTVRLSPGLSPVTGFVTGFVGFVSPGLCPVDRK